MISPMWLGGVLITNVVLGALLVLGVFGLMERRISAGAIGGILVGSGVIYVQATLGERMLDPTVEGMKLLVIAAALGAVLGVVGTVLTVEPEI
jgi:prepilin signal peptidase PulO-like enzyme (type II secretory pathway)